MTVLPAKPLGWLWAILTIFTTLRSVVAVSSRDSPTNSSHPAFVYNTVYGNITFAVTAVQDAGDLYFHLEAPADNSWVAVGAGGQMQGSLIWVVYRSEDGKGVTLCSRTTDGHVEPTHDENIDCELINHNGITNGIVRNSERDYYNVNIYCKGVNNKSFTRSKRHGQDEMSPGNTKISFDSTQQPFIFALGPTDRRLHTNSKGANIRRHSMFGHFTVDMTKAAVNTTEDVSFDELSVVGTWQNHYAQLTGGPTKDRDWGGSVHSALMCGTFVVLFPVGVIFLRLVEKVKWHAWMQGLGLVLIACGVGIGIWASGQYNNSKHINSSHQLLGLAIVGLTFLQFIFGAVHHWVLLRRQHHNPHPTILSRIHLYLGPIVLIAGAANGFLGFNFSGGSYHNIMYGVIVGVVFVGLAVGLFFLKRAKRNKRKRVDDRRVLDEAFEAFRHQGAEPANEREGDRKNGHAMGLRDVEMDEMPPAYEDHANMREGERKIEPRTIV